MANPFLTQPLYLFLLPPILKGTKQNKESPRLVFYLTIVHSICPSRLNIETINNFIYLYLILKIETMKLIYVFTLLTILALSACNSEKKLVMKLL